MQWAVDALEVAVVEGGHKSEDSPLDLMPSMAGTDFKGGGLALMSHHRVLAVRGSDPGHRRLPGSAADFSYLFLMLIQLMSRRRD
ncbi:MAG TPA: hypothetical protein VFS35_08425 [Terrimicrobiaceae bacterium]|nr:hypothetical protein [Terrimicrobiaceae bacterium]